MKELDLHGLSHEDAVLETENFLLKESTQGSFECKIVTGNSPKLQIRIIQEVLDKYDFTYTTPAYNSGVMIVSQTFL